MFGKVAIIVLFAFFAPPGGAVTDDVWTGFTTKWNFWLFDIFKLNSFFAIPQTYDTAVAEGWTAIIGATYFPNITALGLNGDPRYTIFFNMTTYEIVGFQVGFLAKDVDGLSLPVDYNNFTQITRKTLNDIDFYTAAIWYRINDDGSRQLWYEDQWELIEIPTNTDDLLAKTSYLKKNCIRTMGTHYYSITSNSTSADFLPWSFLANGNQIVGALAQAIGTASTIDREWYEIIPVFAIPSVIPDAPESLIENVNKYGVISIHTWFFNDPVKISCD